MLAETPKAGGRFFRAAVVGPVLALALAPDQAGWARRPPDGPRVATTQTVPTWSRAAGRPPLSIRMLTLYAHASDGPCLSARERAGSLTHHQPRQSLAVPWRRPRYAEQPQHSARGEPLLERSGSFAQRVLRSSTRRLAAASFRWTALDRSSSRSTADRAAVFLSGSAPTVRSRVASFRSCPARAATHTAAVARQHTEA